MRLQPLLTTTQTVLRFSLLINWCSPIEIDSGQGLVEAVVLLIQ